jgi:hypothetical protein
LEFSGSVGLIHKEYVTMHGHRIVKEKGHRVVWNEVKIFQNETCGYIENIG